MVLDVHLEPLRHRISLDGSGMPIPRYFYDKCSKPLLVLGVATLIGLPLALGLPARLGSTSQLTP